jgi:hypothetical protein
MRQYDSSVMIEVEFSFTETHKGHGIGYAKNGQAIDPPAGPEWQLDGFTIGSVDYANERKQLSKLVTAIEHYIEQHIEENYNELTK